MALDRPRLPPALLARIRHHQALEDALRCALPDEFARHVFLLHVRGGTLVLACDVQALITPLRFYAPKLLAAAAELIGEDPPVRIAWRALPAPQARPPALQPLYPSAATAEGIEAAARHVKDENLGQALLGLALTLGGGRDRK